MSEVTKLISELRPKPDLSAVQRFVNEAPALSKDLSLTDRVAKISAYIFERWKIEPDNTYLSREKLDNILPDSVLKTKHGHCLGISTLYLLAGETTDLKLSLVRAPDHVFVRACNQIECLNIEPLKLGTKLSDSYYSKELSISPEAINSGIYLKSLDSPKELLASIYLGLGFVASTTSQFDLAELFYQRSIDSSPRFAEPYSNLASIKSQQGQTKAALALLLRAQELNPTHYATAANLGAYYHNKHETRAALKYYNLALRSNPISVQVYRKRAKLYLEIKQPANATLDYDHILEINPNFCDVRKDRSKVRHSLGRSSMDAEQLRLTKDGHCLVLPE